MKREEEWLCESCRIRFEKVGNEVCSSCCKKGQKGMCEDCTTWKKNGKEVCHRALYYYNEEMKDYFRRYKFQGDQLLGYLFAKEIYLELKKYKGYSIVPIPLSQERKEKRVFFRAGREDACALARGRKNPFGVRAAEACVVQTPRAWRVGGAESCVLSRMKCRRVDRGRNEERGGGRKEKGSIHENRSFLE